MDKWKRFCLILIKTYKPRNDKVFVTYIARKTRRNPKEREECIGVWPEICLSENRRWFCIDQAVFRQRVWNLGANLGGRERKIWEMRVMAGEYWEGAMKLNGEWDTLLSYTLIESEGEQRETMLQILFCLKILLYNIVCIILV